MLLLFLKTPQESAPQICASEATRKKATASPGTRTSVGVYLVLLMTM